MDFRGRKLILFCGDILLLYGSLLFVLMMRYWGVVSWELISQHIGLFSVLYVFWLVLFYIFDAYDLSTDLTLKRINQYFVALCMAFFVGVLFFYLISFSEISPKTILFFHVVLFGVVSLFWRRFFFAKVSRLDPLIIGVIGSDKEALELQQLIRSRSHLGQVCVPLRSVEHLKFHIEEQKLNVIVLPSALFLDPMVIAQVYVCLGKGVVFLDFARAYELFAKRIPLSTIEHLWFLQNIEERDRSFYQRSKRWFDIVISVLLILVTLPLWVLLVVVIKLSDGDSVFYTQERMGKNGQLFSIIKFRTMHTDAERNGPLWATKEDTRITFVGGILRRTHLDELPQLLNVLKGDLSLVGPRPERPNFVELLEAEIPHYHVRHFIKPGITGWAQIKFRYARSVVDSQMKFEYDLYYLKNRTFLFDFLILLKTTHFFLKGES
ncbi:exopolysaccharide biosynthesis polyprenyl glycosylphosphotransferase [Candidatus Uhrbacteria bacterium]|nr:exopolysaccharide biosynthesis polyprenyl glycosylphosphotransferase [Candidatus Uhrbacteria bacterium]